jgi:hypothetical protein
VDEFQTSQSLYLVVIGPPPPVRTNAVYGPRIMRVDATRYSQGLTSSLPASRMETEKRALRPVFRSLRERWFPCQNPRKISNPRRTCVHSVLLPSSYVGYISDGAWRPLRFHLARLPPGLGRSSPTAAFNFLPGIMARASQQLTLPRLPRSLNS